jgi:hypothetical protein
MITPDTLNEFKKYYPGLYKGNEVYFDHNQGAIEYVIAAFEKGREEIFSCRFRLKYLEEENRKLKANDERLRNTLINILSGKEGL